MFDVCHATEQIWKNRGFSTLKGNKISHGKLKADCARLYNCLLRSVLCLQSSHRARMKTSKAMILLIELPKQLLDVADFKLRNLACNTTSNFCYFRKIYFTREI